MSKDRRPKLPSARPATGWGSVPFAVLALAAAAGAGSPEDAAAGSTTGGTAGATTTTSATSTATATGVTRITGGTLDLLSFAIVGDTRPPNADDTAGYPTAVITKIWQDVEAFSPRPAFAITTGDYMFANTYGVQQMPQVALYMGARAAFTNVVFAAMG